MDVIQETVKYICMLMERKAFNEDSNIGKEDNLASKDRAFPLNFSEGFKKECNLYILDDVE